MDFRMIFKMIHAAAMTNKTVMVCVIPNASSTAHNINIPNIRNRFTIMKRSSMARISSPCREF
jgi:hypothetical protein